MAKKDFLKNFKKIVDKLCMVSYNKYRTVNIEKRITYKPKPKVNSKARESEVILGNKSQLVTERQTLI